MDGSRQPSKIKKRPSQLAIEEINIQPKDEEPVPPPSTLLGNLVN
jgi:hypothetical protein